MPIGIFFGFIISIAALYLSVELVIASIKWREYGHLIRALCLLDVSIVSIITNLTFLII